MCVRSIMESFIERGSAVPCLKAPCSNLTHAVSPLLTRRLNDSAKSASLS